MRVKDRSALADRRRMRPLVSTVEVRAEVEGVQDLSRVLPVFLASGLVEAGSWSGPCAILQAPGIAQAWAVLPPASDIQSNIQYVDAAMQREWEARGVDWKNRAVRNLHDSSPEPLGTGALFRDNGETWLISLMYPDGLGPSRLLLTKALERIFPRGYQVALPECTRAFAFARQLDREDRDTFENLIQRSFTTSGQPLSPDILDPNDLIEFARKR
jgi:hypothetical protein